MLKKTVFSKPFKDVFPVNLVPRTILMIKKNNITAVTCNQVKFLKKS